MVRRRFCSAHERDQEEQAMRSRSAGLVVATVLLAFPASALGVRAHGDANARIVSANPDGSDFRLLSHPQDGQFDIDPIPSPGGGRVLFERDSEEGSVIV